MCNSGTKAGALRRDGNDLCLRGQGQCAIGTRAGASPAPTIQRRALQAFGYGIVRIGEASSPATLLTGRLPKRCAGHRATMQGNL